VYSQHVEVTLYFNNYYVAVEESRTLCMQMEDINSGKSQIGHLPISKYYHGNKETEGDRSQLHSRDSWCWRNRYREEMAHPLDENTMISSRYYQGLIIN